MKISKLASIALSVLFVAFLAGNSTAAEVKIGIMNVQKIIVQCDAGTAAKVRFDKKMKELQTKFKSEEEELKKLQEEIKKKSSAWSEEKKAEKIRDFQKSGRELQAKTEDARFEMKQMQDKELEPILKALEKVVNKYGANNGYTTILDAKNSVIYFDKSVDISDAIVKKLNKAMAAK
ncbi:MAG: OmpH family outer membrane protein [Desulfobulbaceae bacterium]|nr:OmpH family outer membrane protein [Desulfobulbaceae bacterium]